MAQERRGQIGAFAGQKMLLSKSLIPTFYIEQKTQVASPNVTQNGEYCTFNINNIYNTQAVIPPYLIHQLS